MTGELPFSMWGWPGPNASANIQLADTGERVLSIFLDPVNLILSAPPFPNGPQLTARFYRELARVCAQLSAELDPTVQRPGAHRAGPDGRTDRGTTW
jgi:hypothetical protein